MERERRPEDPFEGEEPPHYLVQRIREALAHDERVSELELQVRVQGRRVFLNGTVPTQERHDAIDAGDLPGHGGSRSDLQRRRQRCVRRPGQRRHGPAAAGLPTAFSE